MPGDPNYELIEYELTEAAALTGLTNKALAARISNGSLGKPTLIQRIRQHATRRTGGAGRS